MQDLKKLAAWLETLVVAAFCGAITGATAAVTVQPINWKVVRDAALAGALVGALALIRKNPFQSDTCDPPKETPK